MLARRGGKVGSDNFEACSELKNADIVEAEERKMVERQAREAKEEHKAPKSSLQHHKSKKEAKAHASHSNEST